MTGNLTEEVKGYAIESGADMVGIVNSRSFGEAPPGHRPEDVLRGAKSIVVMAIRLLDASLENAPSREYSMNYATVNRELNSLAFKVGKLLQNRGFRAVQIPSSPPYDEEKEMGDISHRHAGALAGLGTLGRNSLLLSDRFGPRIRLVSVVTDAELEADAASDATVCEGCSSCVEACPVGAIGEDGTIDKPKCNDHHESIAKELGLESDMSACGICIRACPVGRDSHGN